MSYKYKEEEKIIKGANLANFKICDYLNKISPAIKEGYRLHSMSGYKLPNGDYKFGLIFEKATSISDILTTWQDNKNRTENDND